MSKEIGDAIGQLLCIVQRLRKAYPEKKFTLDGRLVGDIGEVLVKEHYDLRLYEGLRKHHDGKCSDGRNVQIKATMKENLTFPADHVPDYYLGVQVRADGSLVEVFNGRGVTVRDTLKDRSIPKNNLHSVSVRALKKLQEKVRPEDRIPRRRKALKPTQHGPERTMVRVTMEFPESTLATVRQDPAGFARELRLAAAVKWYEMRQASQERAAEIAGLSRADFLSALARFGVSPFQCSAEEVLEEAAQG
jgi:predicted HTH domain antitoxin